VGTVVVVGANVVELLVPFRLLSRSVSWVALRRPWAAGSSRWRPKTWKFCWGLAVG